MDLSTNRIQAHVLNNGNAHTGLCRACRVFCRVKSPRHVESSAIQGLEPSLAGESEREQKTNERGIRRAEANFVLASSSSSRRPS